MFANFDNVVLASAAAVKQTMMTDGHAITWALMCGIFNVISADHLASILALTTLMEPLAAAKVGAYWAVGHTLGMAVIAALLLLVKKVFPQIDGHAWHYYGDYLVGASLIAIAYYLYSNESEYLTENEDGTVVVKSCTCHPMVPEDAPVSPVPTNFSKGFCASYGSAASGDYEDPNDPRDSHSIDECSSLGIGLGIFQGLCCPMGLVGLGLMAGLTTSGILLFMAIFVGISIVGTALLSAGWAALTKSSAGTVLSPHLLYRASYAISALTGVVWIVANMCGFLETLNFGDMHEHVEMESHLLF
eukprot:TRINITY_DN30407_c0_g1_i2.p1 TRINITY_DN30407_c0_g1~~TRINITY_DN30407_c0_g1_i2.p1  ORF type:complete len:303 (-),score=35.00 TRINITY_DN30407_c0_g1_i2:242-1150(-)